MSVSVIENAGQVHVSVRDDGHGFDTSAATAGFGLAGMRESERPRPQRRAGERRILLHREHHDLRLGGLGAQPGDRLQARLTAHVEVQHQHMGAAGQHRVDRGGHAPRLTQDLKAAV